MSECQSREKYSAQIKTKQGVSWCRSHQGWHRGHLDSHPAMKSVRLQVRRASGSEADRLPYNPARRFHACPYFPSRGSALRRGIRVDHDPALSRQFPRFPCFVTWFGRHLATSLRVCYSGLSSHFPEVSHGEAQREGLSDQDHARRCRAPNLAPCPRPRRPPRSSWAGRSRIEDLG